MGGFLALCFLVPFHNFTRTDTFSLVHTLAGVLSTLAIFAVGSHVSNAVDHIKWEQMRNAMAERHRSRLLDDEAPAVST
jgi:hypothetical protein